MRFLYFYFCRNKPVSAGYGIRKLFPSIFLEERPKRLLFARTSCSIISCIFFVEGTDFCVSDRHNGTLFYCYPQMDCVPSGTTDRTGTLWINSGYEFRGINISTKISTKCTNLKELFRAWGLLYRVSGNDLQPLHEHLFPVRRKSSMERLRI